MLASIHMHSHEILQIKVRFPRPTQIWETDGFQRAQEAGRQAVAEYGDEILELLANPRPGRS